MPLKIGSLLDGRYRITARVGHGGMAEVYESTDVMTKRVVAIKLIREDVMSNPVNLMRFQNEASIAASLNHPNIVKVYNHGTVQGVPYIANEFIKGQNLKEVLDFRGALPILEAVDILLQVSSALAYAHSHGVVHRDVKPDNIYVMGDGTVKLGDFGIALSNTISSDDEKNNEIVGSVHYLAPEISLGKLATAQSDIYSVGVTFFELVTGHVPYNKQKAVDIAVAHVREKFPSPKKYLPNCPREVEHIINKCTKKNPKERYQTAKELYEDLTNLKNNPSAIKERKSFFSKLFGFK